MTTNNFMEGGGEMGKITRSFNWSQNILGKPELWPQSLRTTLSIILNSKFPMFLFWGPEAICFYNDAYRPSLGNNGKHPAVGLRGKDCWPEIWETIGPLIGNVLSGGEATWSEDQLLPIYRNGKLENVYWTFSYSPVFDESGSPAGVFVTCSETTGKVIAQQMLEENNRRLQAAMEAALLARKKIEESEERFRTMAEGTDILIAVGDETSNAVYFNTAWEKLTGRSMEDLLEFGWLDLVHPEDKEKYVNIYLTAFKQQLPFTGEFRVLSKDGGYHWLLASGSPRFRADGTFAGYISSCVDITGRKIAEEEKQMLLTSVKASEQKLDQILSQLPAPVVLLRGPNQVIETTNAALLAFWNKQKEEVIGKPMLEVFPELTGQPFPKQWKHVLETGEIITNREKPVVFKQPDNTSHIFYVDYYYQPIADLNGNRTGVLATVINVTDKVESRILLEKREAELQTLNREINAVNEELAAINEEMLATNHALKKSQDTLQLAYMQLTESQQQLQFTIDAAELGTWDLNPATGRFSGNSRLKSWFGLLPEDEIDLYKATDVIDETDRPRVLAAIEEAMDYRSGGVYDIEYTICKPESDIPVFVKAKGKAVFNSQQQPVRFSGTLQDITEQKRDELRKNDFIGMVSHELKTPLTSLKAYVQVLHARSQKNEDDFASGVLDRVDIQVKKMGNMINGFLNISRLESGKILIIRKEFDLNELLKEMIKEAELTLSTHNIKFKPYNTVKVKADRDKIGSVISNLLSNAVKYSPKGKEIQIQCEVIGNSARVSIKDEGIGIAAQHKEKLFERYYRVENQQTQTISGFGIGLYLSAEIIQRHEGIIGVESEPGKGSTFYFSLSLA